MVSCFLGAGWLHSWSWLWEEALFCVAGQLILIDSPNPIRRPILEGSARWWESRTLSQITRSDLSCTLRSNRWLVYSNRRILFIDLILCNRHKSNLGLFLNFFIDRQDDGVLKRCSLRDKENKKSLKLSVLDCLLKDLLWRWLFLLQFLILSLTFLRDSLRRKDFLSFDHINIQNPIS